MGKINPKQEIEIKKRHLRLRMKRFQKVLNYDREALEKIILEIPKVETMNISYFCYPNQRSTLIETLRQEHM